MPENIDQNNNDISRNNEQNNKRLLNTAIDSVGSATEGVPYEQTHFVDTTRPVWNYTLLTEDDIHNFQQGTHYSIYKKNGSSVHSGTQHLGYVFLRMGTQCYCGFSYRAF